MNNYKRLFNNVMQLLGHPARTWLHVFHRGSKGVMLGEFLYPLIMLCGTAFFVGRIFSNGIGWESIYSGIINAALRSLSLLFTYYILTYVLSFFTTKYTSNEYPRDLIDVFTGYSMVVILGLDICLGLFPEMRILAFIAQFYTLKIVWDGAAVLLKIDEERRLGYTMVVSVFIIIMPAVIGKIVGMLSIVLR